jgi:MFS family permease
MPSRRHLYLAAITACLTAALFGYSVGFIGGLLVLPSFLHHFALDHLSPSGLASAQSRTVTVWLLGCVFGVPLGMPVCSRYGRKRCLIFSASLYVAGAAMQLGSGVEWVFDLGRALNGLGVGAGTLVSPM